MMDFPRRPVALLFLLPLGGCAGNVCDRLALEETPEMTRPLVLPEGVPAVTEGGEFRVPDLAAAPPASGCLAVPPMTLPPEALEEPEDDES